MPRVPLDQLPDDARLWVFAADEPVVGEAAETLLARVDTFLEQWSAHGHPLTCGREWRDDRVLIVAVDEASAPATGCSIDAMVRVLKQCEAEFGVPLTDHAHVIWRDEQGRVTTASRPMFAALARDEEVTPATVVFDTTLTRLGDVRAGRLEVPAGQSWHRRAFWRHLAGVLSLALGLIGVSACGGGEPSTVGVALADDHAGFVTLIGDDTLAVEDLRYTDEGLEVTALLRSPEVLRGEYRLRLGESGALEGYEARLWSGVSGEGEPMRVETLQPGDTAWTWSRTSEGETQTREVVLDPYAVPFVDQLHWSFDAALQRRMARGDALFGDLPMFSGARAMTYVVVETDDGGVGLRHPSRGVSAVTLDEAGRLLTLDGYGTTRALIVQRVGALDVPALGARFEALGPMGELSGRGEAEVEVDGATVVLDYGTPQKRGREIFGTLVAYGEVWRTGANAATHITFDRDVVLGGELEVPAGTYTLFSIPREDGATLIVNTRTNINGQSYDSEANLGEVEMRREALDEVVEGFTIGVRDTDEGGLLELLWDTTAYRVDFEVR